MSGKIRVTGVNLGSGLAFIPESDLFDLMSPQLVRTRRGLRLLLRAIGVPMLHLQGGRVVEIHTLRVALKALSRVGQKDFAAPGSILIRKQHAHLSKCTQTLDPSYLADEKRLQYVCGELYMHSLTTLKSAPEDIRSLSSEIARRMIVAGAHLASQRAANATAKKGVDQTWNFHRKRRTSDDPESSSAPPPPLP